MNNPPAVTDVERALDAAINFITNGVALGYIQMPSVKEDTANDVLPFLKRVRAALPTPNVALSENELVLEMATELQSEISSDSINHLFTYSDYRRYARAAYEAIEAHLKANVAPQDTAPLNGGTTQHAEASASAGYYRTSRDGLGDSCDGGVAPQGDDGRPYKESPHEYWPVGATNEQKYIACLKLKGTEQIKAILQFIREKANQGDLQGIAKLTKQALHHLPTEPAKTYKDGFEDGIAAEYQAREKRGAKDVRELVEAAKGIRWQYATDGNYRKEMALVECEQIKALHRALIPFERSHFDAKPEASGEE